jgi:Sulfotransferase family
MTPVPFAILAIARSGSWHLVETLNQHPHVAANGEILNPDDTGWPATVRNSGMSPLQLVRYSLEAAPPRGQKKLLQARGVKLLQEHLEQETEVWDYLTKSVNLRVLLLRRINLLAALRSKRQANLTGVWQVLHNHPRQVSLPTVTLTAADCVDFFNSSIRFYERVRRDLSQHLLEITYEELVLDRKRTSEKIYSFLGVGPLPNHTDVVVQQEHRPNKESILNYEELVDTFAGTGFEQFIGLCS